MFRPSLLIHIYAEAPRSRSPSSRGTRGSPAAPAAPSSRRRRGRRRRRSCRRWRPSTAASCRASLACRATPRRRRLLPKTSTPGVSNVRRSFDHVTSEVPLRPQRSGGVCLFLLLVARLRPNKTRRVERAEVHNCERKSGGKQAENENN